MPAGNTQTPRPFLLRQVDPRLVKEGRVWAVKQGERWRFTVELCVQVSLLSLRDPHAGDCLSGVGVVRCLGRGSLVITS